MLPSRAIVRPGPSLGLRRQLQGQCANTLNALSQRLGHGRHLSSLRSSQSSVLSTFPFRARNIAGPITVGGVASSRQFSVWGFGKNKAVEENASSTPVSTSEATSAPEAVRAVDPTPDKVLPTPATEPTVPPSEIDFSSISDIVNGQDIANMPEQIGYLSALGLDFGWGPTAVMQWALEHVHIYTGLGWGASIMLTAVLLRCVMFYPQIRSLKFNAKMQDLRKDSRSQEATKLFQQGLLNGDRESQQRSQYLNRMLRQQYGVSNVDMIWSFGQIPFTFGLFRVISAMANVPVPAMENAGYLWFSDLTATDPYFILPAAGTALMIGALTINAQNVSAQQKKTLKVMTYLFGSIGFVATTFLSAAVNLMAVALGAATLITAVVLNHAPVRRTFGLPPVVTPPPIAEKTIYEAPRPQGSLRERLNANLNDMKTGLSEQFSNYTGTYTGTEQDRAEKKRRELLRKLEETRKQQERDAFDKKYKGKK